MVWFRVAPLALAGLLACERAGLAPAPARGGAQAAAPAVTRELDPQARERVAYPRGQCSTGWIEVQVHEPSRGWVPHPEHPRIRAGEVHAELAFRLLDLRVRCIDLSGKRTASDWVRGVDLEAKAP